jgi:hypothetical protein
MLPMKPSAELPPERYYGVEISDDGGFVVAERINGDFAAQARYPAGRSGTSAFCDRIARQAGHPHVCIRSRNGASLALASALMTLPGSEVTLVTSQAIAARLPGGRLAVPENADERARRLARLAERLF